MASVGVQPPPRSPRTVSQTSRPSSRTTMNDFEDNLNALLADLQNTISPSASSSYSPHHYNSTTGYGSLERTQPQQHRVASPTSLYSAKASSFNPLSPPPVVNRYESYEYRTSGSGSGGHQSPVYQNQTMSSSSPTGGTKVTSFNNNLSELDTLLQDLSNARYNAQYGDKKESIAIVNGSPSGRRTISPKSPSSASLSSGGIQEARPSVDALLDELSLSVPNGNNPDDDLPRTTYTKVTIEEKTTHNFVPAPTAGPTASTATKELDDLMASLSDFKINSVTVQQHTEPSYAKPNRAVRSPDAKQNQLDSMLGNLQADMSKQGVNTSQKGCCAGCDKPIVGQVITALGKTWHPEHFTCAHCNEELGTKSFFERDGKPYCENDYHKLFSPTCAYCNGPIMDKCVTALDRTWHPEHFFCAKCGKQFGEDGFHEKNGKPYCREDYLDMFAPKCGGCGQPIMDNYISALNQQWHPKCFVCRDCRQPFQGGSFYDHEGLPYCETHYHAKRGSLCAGCHKPITGRCITAMFRKFHPEHFVCSFCLKQLNKGTFKEQSDKPYCHSCFEKLFG